MDGGYGASIGFPRYPSDLPVVDVAKSLVGCLVVAGLTVALGGGAFNVVHRCLSSGPCFGPLQYYHLPVSNVYMFQLVIDVLQ